MGLHELSAYQRIRLCVYQPSELMAIALQWMPQMVDRSALGGIDSSKELGPG